MAIIAAQRAIQAISLTKLFYVSVEFNVQVTYAVNMTQITLHTIKPMVIEKLQNLAQEHQRSLEEEISVILENAVGNQEESKGNTFWDGLLHFRQIIESEELIFTDDDFANLRDRTIGREIEL